jgi:hypothetical protein
MASERAYCRVLKALVEIERLTRGPVRRPFNYVGRSPVFKVYKIAKETIMREATEPPRKAPHA